MGELKAKIRFEDWFEEALKHLTEAAKKSIESGMDEELITEIYLKAAESMAREAIEIKVVWCQH